MTNRPRRDPAATPPEGSISFFQQILVSPHETTPPPRPGSTPGRGRGRRADPAGTPPKIANKFSASTCRTCGAITIAGLTHGLRVDLEPQVLDDHTEYAALLAGVPTYDLWPDRIARQRHLENIRQPDKTHRHARHTCGTTYGTEPRPTPPATTQRDPNGPPPF